MTGPLGRGIIGVFATTVEIKIISPLLSSKPLEGTMRYSWPLLREFHISRQARDYYQFDQTLFSLSGNVIFADFSVLARLPMLSPLDLLT